MRRLFSFVTVAMEAFRQFASREIYAEKPLPPIRYDGDVTDIYLA
ncbi:MAG: hypothetical protein AB8B50_03840 [Pirellulaceae bacterium]